MTSPELQRVGHRSTALAGALDEVGAQVERVARRVAAAWPDEHGREWTERALLVRRALAREADVAAELGRAIARLADGIAADGPTSLPFSGAGPRLGGTAARRAADERGVRIPRLGDDGGGA